MRKAAVYYKDFLAGILTETDDGDYTFEYDEKYVMEHPKEGISLTMPVRSNSYTEKRLFPFFEGLIPEGMAIGDCVQKLESKSKRPNGLATGLLPELHRSCKYTTNTKRK